MSTIEEGIVKFVTTDEEMVEVWLKCRREKLDFARSRTTVEPFMGVVDGVNFSIDVREILRDED